MLVIDRASRANFDAFGVPSGLSSIQRRTLAGAIGASMAIVCLLDALSRQSPVLSVLHVVAIFAASWARSRAWVLRTASGCVLLTLASFAFAQGFAPRVDQLVRCAVTLVAIGMTGLLALRNVAGSCALRTQALLLDTTHDAVSVRELDGSLNYWNQGAVNLFGWTFEEARRRRSSTMLKTDTDVPPGGSAALIRNGTWNGEVKVTTKAGRHLVTQVRCSLLHDEHGRPAGVLTTAMDVTAARAADAELRRSEARYRTIFQCAGVAIWECDFSALHAHVDDMLRNGAVDLGERAHTDPHFIRRAMELVRAVDANDAALSMFGVAEKDVLLGPVSTRWPRDAEPVFLDAVMTAIQGGSRFFAETSQMTADGRLIDILLAASFPTGWGESVFISMTEITEHNLARAALSSAQSELAHASRLSSLGQLTATIAHEVNQPLGAIISNGQAGQRWLRRENPNVQEALSSLGALVEDALRAGAVIARFRSLARNEAPVLEPVDLNHLAEDTMRLLSHEQRRRGVQVTVALDPRSPIVIGDRIQLQQVMINLVMNAMQAMNEAAVAAPRLHIGTDVEEGSGILLISDNGPGIAKDADERLFEAFATTRADGLGLGLSVSDAIMRRHGGSLAKVDQAEGAGFRAAVPLATDAADVLADCTDLR